MNDAWLFLDALVAGSDEQPDRRHDQTDDAQNGEGDAEKCHQPASPGGRQPTYCFESRRVAEARFQQASGKSHHDQSDWQRWNAVVLLSAQHLVSPHKPFSLLHGRLPWTCSS